jgi:WD40 repeat protein
MNYSKDGKRLVVGTALSLLYIYDFESDTIKKITKYEHKDKDLYNIALNNEGTIFVAATNKGTLNAWDIDKNKLIQTYSDPGVTITAIKLSSDGKTIISSGYDGKIKFWDFASGKLKYSSGKKETSLIINDLNISHDDKYLVIGDLRNDGIMMFGLDLASDVKEEIIKDNCKIKIYPNPATDYIEIQPSEGFDIQIFDMLGTVVASIHPMTTSHRMNIEHLAPGMYFIKIGNRVEKFVKM